MAIKKCKECGHDVSSKAKNCPNCGAKLKSDGIGASGFLVLLILGFAAIGFLTMDETAPTRPTSLPATTPTATAEQPPQAPSWRTSVNTDEMTGKVQAFAISPRVSATEPMGWPYNDTRAWLGVGCNDSDEWAYFGFTDGPNITDDKTESGYSVINTRVRWDQSIENTQLLQEWGASSIHFKNAAEGIQKIVGRNSVLLELNWYGEGRVYFEFSLKGSSAAVQQIRSSCR